MEAGFIAWIVVSILVGIVIGMNIKSFKTNNNETQGIIYAYYGETGSGPSLLLEYSVPIDDIASRKRVTFDVTVIR